MPGDAENMFYKFEMGPVQFVCISSEFYYYLEYGTHMAINQYSWLENVLKVGNLWLLCPETGERYVTIS